MTYLTIYPSTPVEIVKKHEIYSLYNKLYDGLILLLFYPFHPCILKFLFFSFDHVCSLYNNHVRTQCIH